MDQAQLQPIKSHKIQKIKKTYFDCECTKRYSTFPALYLHCQRKHGLKISTRYEEEPCKVQTFRSQRVITFFLRMNEDNGRQSMKSFQLKLKGIISSFSETLYSIDSHRKSKILECLKRLQKFLTRNFSTPKAEADKTIFKNIPDSFNGFMIKQSKKLSRQNRLCWMETLIQLSLWLFKEGITENIIVKNEEYKDEAQDFSRNDQQIQL